MSKTITDTTVAPEQVMALLTAMTKLNAKRITGKLNADGEFVIEAERSFNQFSVSVDELAEMMGESVTPFLINQWAKKRVISSVKEGKTRFFILPVVAADFVRQLDLGLLTPDYASAERLLIDWLRGDFIPNHLTTAA